MQRARLCRASVTANGQRLIVYGVLQQANSRNRNGRIYPKVIRDQNPHPPPRMWRSLKTAPFLPPHALQRILEREAALYQSLVAKGLAYGEADHPSHDVRG